MKRNQHKALKAKFDKFAVGYGPVVSAILGALRTTLFGHNDDINYISPVQNWDKYVNDWRDLPMKEKMALIDKSLDCLKADVLNKCFNAPSVPVDPLFNVKRTKPSIKIKKA